MYMAAITSLSLSWEFSGRAQSFVSGNEERYRWPSCVNGCMGGLMLFVVDDEMI